MFPTAWTREQDGHSRYKTLPWLCVSAHRCTIGCFAFLPRFVKKGTATCGTRDVFGVKKKKQQQKKKKERKSTCALPQRSLPSCLAPRDGGQVLNLVTSVSRLRRWMIVGVFFFFFFFSRPFRAEIGSRAVGQTRIPRVLFVFVPSCLVPVNTLELGPF